MNSVVSCRSEGRIAVVDAVAGEVACDYRQPLHFESAGHRSELRGGCERRRRCRVAALGRDHHADDVELGAVVAGYRDECVAEGRQVVAALLEAERDLRVTERTMPVPGVRSVVADPNPVLT